MDSAESRGGGAGYYYESNFQLPVATSTIRFKVSVSTEIGPARDAEGTGYCKS